MFVSNWQAQAFISQFGIPWSRCPVILNAIESILVSRDRFAPVPAGTPVRLVYTPVPNRGLAVLHAVFSKICELRGDVNALRDGNAGLQPMLAAQKAYADYHYGRDRRVAQWAAFLHSIADLPPNG